MVLWQGEVATAFGQQEKGVGGQGRIVDDLPVTDHRLELLARHPLVPDAVFLRLGVSFSRRQPGGEKVIAVLGCHAVAGGELAKVDEVPGAQPRLLGQLQPGELFGRAGLAVREAALRERPAAPADGIAVLLDEVEAAAFGRDDQSEVAPLYDGVGAP